MFETLSDSSSRTDTQDSFSTSSARSALKKQQLKELNNELIKENALLRSQFEEAVEITSQFQELHRENQTLVAQNSAIQQEKEDLDHRLEICLAANHELTRKLNEEKRNHSQQNDTNICAMNNEIDKVREQAKAQLDSVLGELEKVKALHDKDVLQQKTAVGRIDRVLQAGERFFNVKFSTVDDLISHFEKTQNQVPETPIAAIPPPPTGGDHSDKRIRRYKNKLKEAEQVQASYQNEISKAQSDIAELQTQLSNKNIEFQTKINEATEEKERLLSKKDSQIASLEAQISQLKTELKVLQTHSGVPGIPGTAIVNKSSSESKEPKLSKVAGKRNSNPEDLAKIQQLQQDNDILEEKLAAARQKQEQAELKLVDAEANNNTLKLQVEKLNTEIATNATLKEATNKEIESLRSALHSKKMALQEIQIPPPQKPAPNVAKYQRIIEEQKGKILALNQAADKQHKLFEKQDIEISILNQKVKESESQYKALAEDYQEYRQKVESKKPVTAEDFLPADAFRCPEFDGPLASCVQKIATNSSLQPVTKLQKAFKAICAHYGNNLHEIQQSLEETTKENQFLSSSFNKFIIDLSIAVTDQPTTIEDFFKANGGQKLLEKVADFRVRYDDMRHHTDRLKDILISLNQCGFGDPSDPVGQLTELRNQFTLQSEILASKSNKLKRMRRDYKELLQTSDAYKSETKKRLDTLTTKVHTLTEQVQQYETSNRTLVIENQRISKDLRDSKNRIDNFEEELKRHEAELIAEISKDDAEKMDSLSKKFTELLKTYNELVEDYNHQEDESKNLESVVEQQKRQIAAKERETADLRKKLHDNEVAAEKRLENEKNSLSETYKGAIAELTEQCNKHRADVERMAKDVAENEKQMALNKSEFGVLKKQKIKAENELKQLIAKVEREKKLMETNYTAKRCQYETDMNRRITEDHQKFEQEKRRICGYAAEAFKLFFNASAAIDEKSYRNVIEQARDELTKLTKSDAAVRRLVAARDNQTTEDAVAQVLMTSS
ncbi:hypothetical protein M9Y10_036336 [Tritrichomonas musculus]|uniref:Uncharacterized protein n=1 Tax=Tritrichomonas musculus TaxID=1915356 RepID=A0ABR2GVV9_9EUKA